MVSLGRGRPDIAFPTNIAVALANPFDRAAIDIPIGMTNNGKRCCDLLARDMLRPHASRVFTGARRWIWQEFDSRADASREAWRRGQKGVQCQLWNLGPKIMEVDTFMRAHRGLDIREVHPELVFLRLNGGKPLPSKKLDVGIAIRRELVKAAFPDLDHWLADERIGTGAGRDDVLDACAVAIAARDPVGSLPEGTAPLDEFQLPMRIWF